MRSPQRPWLPVPLVILWLLLAVPAQSQQVLRLRLGSFEYQVTTNGILITAPHGTFDRNTAPLAITIAKNFGSGYVIAKGFHPGVRINVNRPTEGANLPCDREPQTERAREAWAEYQRLVGVASGGVPLQLYVEVHGNSRQESSQTVEVAIKGLRMDEAVAVKSAYAAILEGVMAQWPAYPGLQLLIEPADHIFFTASCDKRLGMLANPAIPRAIHFEFPAVARESSFVPASALLAAGVIEKVRGR